MRLLTGLALIILIPLLALFLFSGDNFDLLKSMFIEEHTNDEIIEKMGDFGIKGYITVGILSMLQVIFAVVPAEPVQVLAGISFGFPLGLLTCTAGVILGNTIIFILFKIYGDSIRGYFVKKLKVDLEAISESTNIVVLVFILYFLPAIPYGMICFMAASLGMRYPRYITVTVLGAIPSVCIGVGFGHMAGATSWVVSAVVFSVIVVLLIIATVKRNALFEKLNDFLTRPPYSSKTVVKPYRRILLSIAYVISRIIFFLRGVRVRYTKKVGKDICTPSIVLCNHGSFIDFAYAGSLIRKHTPNFIVARYYFYNKWVGRLLRKFGCFPKSMFASDLESAKNCRRVLRDGRVLAMMPEARLSTVGRFEDIQEGTYSFLKKAGVPVYSIKICGDYLADPKWGNGLRRGSLIEAELDILFTLEELSSLSVEEIKRRTEERLSYDEFAWLKQHPRIRYRSKRLAEGLQNVLTLCPQCHARYTIQTKGHDVFCESCGLRATMTSRYEFSGDSPFENFADWYDWQREEMKKRISEDPEFALSSPVEFFLPSHGGKGFLRTVGKGECRLDAAGLTYFGTKEGESVTLHFPIQEIYRLLFGAGVNFEVYVGSEIHFFAPEEKRSAVDFYIASAILYDQTKEASLSLSNK